MSEVVYKNTRFDPDLTPFHGLAKEMAQAFGYTADLAVDKELAQLLRLRVAQRNECSYCIILHAKTAREIGIPAPKVDNISSWWESELFSEKEQVALQYADFLTEGQGPGFQEAHEVLADLFSEREIAEIAAIVINMNVWTRLKLAQGQVPGWQE
ncbi:carboxymuconolactone decarboxylase family protein [Roseibacillus ishigakijimensis]|uniref:Carboxymuconolactone decarboxylase family protein n=1 Tax=Roseibacillus ishigakijimensis TaxID=454146 RepID=A0A934RTS5_9BACT|nr:carboxymuconolactone decarboxylase family protein [Roseibacillus ishigakijimensis]MBK1834030.1 carboxymuconolactone decarboxylase family protein [Roseibacillus ishigakijimensis]